MSDLKALPPVPAATSERQVNVVQHAIRFMRQHLDRDFSIADVCAVVHVSRRTLQYHFERSLHMSPQQYLKVLRLNSAHSLLRRIATTDKAPVHNLSIAEVAAMCGYEHASRFAGDYKRQFGQLPSETLRDVSRPARIAA